MNMALLSRIVAVWLLLIPVAILNGLVREFAISPAVGPVAGHMISTVLLALLIWLVAYLMLRKKILGYRGAEALAAGALLVTLTVAFEFLFGRYVVGKTWDVLLYDYNILAGRVWVLVLVALLVAPLAVRLRALRATR